MIILSHNLLLNQVGFGVWLELEGFLLVFRVWGRLFLEGARLF